MDGEESWDPLEREAVSDAYCPFLDQSDSALYLWDMFIRAGLVHGRSSWHVFCDHCLQWCKLSICVNSYNTKSLLSIVDVHLIEGGVDCLRFPVRKMVYRSKEMFSAKVKEERYCIHKEYA